ncbi:MAG TPA: hypothetical protein VIJ62_11115 [Rhizomicrobium sp.]
MSELMSARKSNRDFRWQLLTTVSVVALLAAVYGANEAKAEDQDADRPTVWIELGGAMEHVGGQGDNFPVAFQAANPTSSVLQSPTPFQAQNPPPFSFSEGGKISVQPEGSNWVFFAAAAYGRTSNSKDVDHQTNRIFYVNYVSGAPRPGQNPRGIDKFADTQVSHKESHAVLDFMAGKDVGLGMFGNDGSSTFSLGVRFAQFSSKATFDVRARPNVYFKYYAIPSYHVGINAPYFHTYHATGHASRSFHGIGPSLSWNGSVPVAGNPQNGEVTLDWGANAALLFGRQKARVQHQESAHYVTPYFVLQISGYHIAYVHPAAGHNTDRSVAVPNAGGFAGLSFRYSDAKLSAGYRADFFFGAMDGGIDTAKRENVGFYGPFATISVGIGG